MAIKNKRLYGLYLDEEKTEYVKSFLESTRNKKGLSGIVDSNINALYKTLKASEYVPGKKLTFAKIMRIAKNGLTQTV